MKFQKLYTVEILLKSGNKLVCRNLLNFTIRREGNEIVGLTRDHANVKSNDLDYICLEQIEAIRTVSVKYRLAWS